jgi:hypothetical protein
VPCEQRVAPVVVALNEVLEGSASRCELGQDIEWIRVGLVLFNQLTTRVRRVIVE